ncbi:hypothetical protein KR009_008369, partial [Drosophila setifemur]
HFSGLLHRQEGPVEELWKPYVSFNRRLARKMSGTVCKRSSSLRFLPRRQSKRFYPTCTLPLSTRRAPKTIQPGEWPLWRRASLRPLLLPSSNIWTGLLTQRFYLVNRQPVPEVLFTEAESEAEELQLERRNHKATYDPDENPDRQQANHNELMAPGTAHKWLPVGSEDRREDLSQELVQSLLRQEMRSRRRPRMRYPSEDPQLSELEQWLRLEEHMPVPIFQGQSVEQEHLKSTSESSARMVGDQSPWQDNKLMAPWGGLARVAHQLGDGRRSKLLPTIRAAKSNLLLAQEHHLYRHGSVAMDQFKQSERPAKKRSSRMIRREQEKEREEHGLGGGVGAKQLKGTAQRLEGSERALLKQHLADLLPVTQPHASFRIQYQRKAPTRQLLEEGRCQVNLERDLHSNPVKPYFHIQSDNLERSSSSSPHRGEFVSLQHRDGAMRPRAVELVRKPALMSLILQRPSRKIPSSLSRSSSLDVGASNIKQSRSGRGKLDLVSSESELESKSSLQRRMRASSARGTRPAQLQARKVQVAPLDLQTVSELQKPKLRRLPSETFRKLDSPHMAQVKELPHPFKNLELPRTKELEVATTSKQATLAKNYKYEVAVSYQKRGARSTSTKSRRVEPPRQPVVSSKVQVPEPKDPAMYTRTEASRRPETSRRLEM